MKKMERILVLMFVILSLCSKVFADDPPISDLEKYGPDMQASTNTKVALPEGASFQSTPVKDLTINSETANQIKQIVIVGQGANPLQDITSTTPLSGANSSGAAAMIPTNGGQTQAIGTSMSVLTNKNISAEKPKNISAPTYALINATTNQIYDTKTGTEKYNPSGLVNLMTAYIAAQHLSLDAELSVKATAVGGLDKDASIVSLRAGDKITLKNALISMFVKGAVDAANVVAENVSGSRAAFVDLMNTTALSLGLTNTKFTDPAGILDTNESTALEMAVIMARVCERPELAELLSITQYTLPETNSREKLLIFNKNTMLAKEATSYNADVAGSRMAFTSKSKYCIASLMNYNNNKIIAVILKAEGTQFGDTKKLLEFAKIAIAE